MSTVIDSHSYTYTAPMDYFSRHSNSAGAPLPRIPRRTSSSRSLGTASSSTAAAIHNIFAVAASAYSPPATPAALVIHPPTPPRPEPSAQPSESEDVTSSSSSSDAYVQMLNPRTKRIRKPKMNPLRAPADSTPTPAVLKAKASQEKSIAFPTHKPPSDDGASGNETPRQSSYSSKANMRIDIDSLQQPFAESSLMAVRSENSGRTVSAPHANAAGIARKKSGEPLKSSLKSRRPIVRGDLSVVTGLSSTKSEPNTPMGSKSVHFDAQLEKVKLFLAEQKPIAISREGSPTDTSGTESDFPSSIYGSRREEEDKMLTMQVSNMPAAPPADTELALEALDLSPEGTALNGTVRVKNLAFEKWVAVRFTVDSWQTTSEVTARYSESIEGSVYDRFVFTIRLGDMLARIEEKTLFFALRYNVAGREIWDNNGAENYRVTFAKVLRPRPSQSADSGLASLKSKLERVVNGQETVGGYVAHAGRKAHAESFTLQSATSLASRYDFAASLKSPWARPSPVESPGGSHPHARTNTYPHALPQFPRRMATKQAYTDGHPLTRGSPRILDADDDNTPTPPAFQHAASADLRSGWIQPVPGLGPFNLNGKVRRLSAKSASLQVDLQTVRRVLPKTFTRPEDSLNQDVRRDSVHPANTTFKTSSSTTMIGMASTMGVVQVGTIHHGTESVEAVSAIVRLWLQ
ncbi:Carbohydrate-Binding Module Family 21 protein [Trametes cinnabarina]|uniref:Carbohydrate-Binding Module Family 21 protein n=1 Tax=Pycnoporus cinnabarinus TaxID=5643 RepID=A0A060SC07_PYCCI|nr:Carbohydrate-Binding Module Family 21 protein [Trametes cinnabarina]